MISPKFYSQISVCQACKGWGTNSQSGSHKLTVCRECSGEGIAVFQSQKTYSWTAPDFMDYKGRQLQQLKKLFLILSPILGIILFLTILRVIFLYS